MVSKYHFPIKRINAPWRNAWFQTGKFSLDQPVIPEDQGVAKGSWCQVERVTGAKMKRLPLANEGKIWKPKGKYITVLGWNIENYVYIHHFIIVIKNILIVCLQRILENQPIITKMDYYRKKTYIHPIFIYKLYLIATTLMRESSF